MATSARPIAIIEAPSNLGLMPLSPGREPGTRKAPATLRQLGLHEAVNAQKIIAIEPPPYQPDDERTINVRNIDRIVEYSVRLADAVESVTSEGFFPLVLGGDCSILIGAMLSQKRRGDPALLFIDGHTDFFVPEQSGTGGAAGMDLALVTGWGPEALTGIEGRGPYVQPSRVAAMGNRDFAKRPAGNIPSIEDSGMHYTSLAGMRATGMEKATASALEAIGRGQSPYWIHLDIDVLDSQLMPAVDSPQADGLLWQELETVLSIALAGNAAGLEVTIYDPDRDPGLAAGRGLVSLLAAVLSGGKSAG